MKQKTLAINEVVFLFILAAIVIFFASLLIISSLRADFLYKKILSQAKPNLKLELADYYSQSLFTLTKAINLRKDDADYYAEKADYLFDARYNNLKDKLSIDESEIERLYKKAIKLNPINFEYHLKLGWFYIDKDKKTAEEELLSATELYPAEYQVYLFLTKFYIMNKDYMNAFSNLLLSLHYAGPHWWGVMEKIKDSIKNLDAISYNIRKRKLVFKAYPDTFYFDFEKKRFPHIQTPLAIKVYIKEIQTPLAIKIYIKELDNKVSLYVYDSVYSDFERAESSEGVNVYKFNIDFFPPETYLDSFIIKTDPPTPIEKIEFIKKF